MAARIPWSRSMKKIIKYVLLNLGRSLISIWNGKGREKKMRQWNEQIVALIGPDVRKHPEILLTSGFLPWGAFNDAEWHVPMEHWYMKYVMQYYCSMAPNSEDIQFWKLGLAKPGKKSGLFFHQVTIVGISELILSAKWPSGNDALTTRSWK